MDNIKDVLNAVIGNIAAKTPDTHNKIERIWQNLLTPQEHKHTKIDGVKEGTLFLNVDSPAWLYQMRIRKSRILRQLQDEVSDVKAIRLKIGKVT